MGNISDRSNIERVIFDNILAYERKMISLHDLKLITADKIRKANENAVKLHLKERTLNEYIQIMRNASEELRSDRISNY